MAVDRKSYENIMKALLTAMKETMLAAGADKGAVDKLMSEITKVIFSKK